MGELDVEIRLADKEWLDIGFDVEQITTKVISATFAELERLNGLPQLPSGIEIGLLFTDDAEMKHLNATYRKVDQPTNVLAFPTSASPEDLAAEARRAGEIGAIGLGDVVLARQTIAREAEAAGRPIPDHLSHLIAHGILHLLGFDHEEEAEAKRMEGMEIAILGSLGIADPYDQAGGKDGG